MALIGLVTAFVVALIADGVGAWRGDAPIRQLARTGFATLVLVDVGVLPGLVDAFGSAVAFGAGVVL
ncbi:hypothetical protein SAMN04488063_0099 [Halopelagius inordinatus]|uniref:Uncharacterized protein n=1 Tax=Halopelagius inordinatus TaxID=553467 RepID=A0A1I2X1V5_9EURY|nr:hypothetical protein [Halopelagius inordinatus]SFH07518.1 hypothetical protein SAMN04488063_0099 [Halopelagius inordinatus]